MRNVCLMGKEVVVIRPLFVIFPSLIFISAKQYGHLVISSFCHFSFREALVFCSEIPSGYFTTRLAHHHIESHHQHETDGKADGAEIGVLTAGSFGDEFLNHDVEHGTCCKGEHIGKDWHKQ